MNIFKLLRRLGLLLRSSGPGWEPAMQANTRLKFINQLSKIKNN